MSFLKNINQLRPSDSKYGDNKFIDWNRAYLWDIRFQNRAEHKSKLSGSFADWFPASSVTEDIAHINTYRFDTPLLGGLTIPQSASARKVSITFYDDEKGSILTWLKTWINIDILNQGQYLTPLSGCVKLVNLAKLNIQREIIETRDYWVIPEGVIQDNFSSSSETNEYTVLFNILGQPKGSNL